MENFDRQIERHTTKNIKVLTYFVHVTLNLSENKVFFTVSKHIHVLQNSWILFLLQFTNKD